MTMCLQLRLHNSLCLLCRNWRYDKQKYYLHKCCVGKWWISAACSNDHIHCIVVMSWSGHDRVVYTDRSLRSVLWLLQGTVTTYDTRGTISQHLATIALMMVECIHLYRTTVMSCHDFLWLEWTKYCLGCK